MTVLISTFALAALIAWAAVIDIRSRRIPNYVNALLAASGLAATLALQRSFADALIGAAAGYGTIFLLIQAYRKVRGRDGIGLGDAKMLAGAGVWVGWANLPFVLLGASLLGIAFALTRRLKAADHIPFAPFIGVGLFAVWMAAVVLPSADQALLQAAIPPTDMIVSGSPSRP